MQELDNTWNGNKGQITNIDNNNNKGGFGFSKVNILVIVKMMVYLSINKKVVTFVISYVWRLFKVVN